MKHAEALSEKNLHALNDSMVKPKGDQAENPMHPDCILMQPEYPACGQFLRRSSMMASSAEITSVLSTSDFLNWSRRLKVFAGGRY